MNNVKKIRSVRVLSNPVIVGDTAIIQKSDTLGSYIVEQNGVDISEGTVSVVTAQTADSTSPSEAVVTAETADQLDNTKPWFSVGSDFFEGQSLYGPAIPVQPQQPQQPQSGKVETTKQKSFIVPLLAAIAAIILINN